MTIKGVRTYHIGLSRDRARTATGVVHKPRHFILYGRGEEDGNVIDIGRVLRDDRDLVRHLRVGSAWQNNKERQPLDLWA